ncbi:MAG: PBECR2 nuclease fold domain-containing protein, partial [Reyranella sp.]|nr:PBECR2 nuclease fold domain-containing protein [Reyranella sp.]
PAPLAAGVTTEEAAAAFTSRLGFAPGAAGLFTDAGGDPFPVSPALFKTASGAPRRLTAAARRGLPLAAEAIAAPDEIRWIWTEGERAQLVRRYVRRVAQPGGKVVEVVVDAVAGGAGPWWSWRTSLDGPLDLTAYRSGVLAWAHRPGGDN